MGKGKQKRSPKGGAKGPGNVRQGSQQQQHNAHGSNPRSAISKKQKRKQQRQQHQQDAASRATGEHKAPKGPSNICPYVADQRTLLLGEGDVSFGAALAIVWGDATNLVATVFDEEALAMQKYANLSENIETIRSLGGLVLFGVDAAKASAVKAVRSRGPFDRIIFNFP